MKSTWFGNRKRYEFARCVSDVKRGHDDWRLFSDFLALSSIALRQGVRAAARGDTDDKLEDDYMKIVKPYGKASIKFSEALGLLVEGLEDDAHDFLGCTLGEMGMLDKNWKGQCFTPPSLCETMAQLMFQDAKPEDFQDSQMHWAEPACGGGAMLIACAKVLRRQGFGPGNHYVIANDIDARCFQMCFIQATLLDIPGTVMQANTLTLEQWDSAVTFAGIRHPMRSREGKKIEGGVETINGIKRRVGGRKRRQLATH